MRRPELTRKSAALAGGGLAAVVLVVASAFSCTYTEPDLRSAAFRPTTTTTAPIASTASTASTSTVPSSSTNTAPTTTAPTTTTAPPVTAGTTAPPTAPPSTATTSPPSSGPVTLSALPALTSQVATVREGVEEVAVYASSDSAEEVEDPVPARGDYGQLQVFLVLQSEGGRLRVRLPIRPNGSEGWIDADQVDVASHDYQIQVSLSEYRMLVQQGDEVVLDTAIGVGTTDTPTVGGEFYTWVLIDPTNAGYGSYAYGLSGFSTLESFNGGDGRMGIHGTTDQSSIGRNVSRGCIRIPDEVVVELVQDVGLPLGVPVVITA